MNANSLFILADHFSFNTNIIETNVLNLAVVLAVVVIYVGDALKGLLANRKETIVTNFQEADRRALQAKERVNQAQIQFEEAKQKASKIRNQASITIENEKEKFNREITEDLNRLKVFQQESYKLEQQKVQNQIAEKLIELSLNQVKKKIKLRLNSSNHSILNNFQIVLFTNYKKN
ncbi:atpF (chloroplast) [Auxenochlorella protothecoides x Auxenochlorella symbiontica]|uniref:ATP synthase subunit b, chloroplastic n=1 Tax=Auxenochlorella protothecoides TaxID=3075 RepID=A0A023HHT4_AUXPR|nr:CF0 subunit I of ATP synthase [Auxenochlorella protothecoides]AGL10877.1 CF0 subunit I of ATP synthase [Auxenochlorella protothecoides]AGN72520.1 ATP synthase CF0 B subunit [Auxenochlorella protothecoides]ARU77468.1 ATP synthase F0 sector subunit b [Auxenochlorella protothecoides]